MGGGGGREERGERREIERGREGNGNGKRIKREREKCVCESSCVNLSVYIWCEREREVRER